MRLRVALASFFAVTLLAVICVAAAFAGSGSGYVGNWDGGSCTGCRVVIHNGTTGANGATITNGNGTYTVNMQAGQQYSFWVDTCKVHSRLTSGQSAYVNGGNPFLPTLTASPAGAC